MQMPNDLSATRIAVVDDTETIFGNAPIARNLFSRLEESIQHRSIRISQIECRRNVLARDQQYMVRSLRVEILEGDQEFVLINDLAGNLTGDDFAKNTVHNCLPNQFALTNVLYSKPSGYYYQGGHRFVNILKILI